MYCLLNFLNDGHILTKKGSLSYMLADTNETKLKMSSFIRRFQFTGTCTF